jgi:sterol desaturase/sphingolipid hydroxylase (fatty acid hydroxylase superfamily)
MKINDFLIRYLVQPTLLLAAFAVACVYGATPMTAALVLLLSQITLGALEHYYPKRADWQISWRNKGRDLLSFMLYSMAAVLVIQCYETYLGAWFTQLRQSVGMDWWPQHWPVWARIFLALSLSELVWYIFHRLEHRFYPIIRLRRYGYPCHPLLLPFFLVQAVMHKLQCC